MRAMVMTAAGSPLELRDVPVPQPDLRQVLVRVAACGVCRTDLHVLDGELAHPKLPLILGHEVAGEIVATGREVEGFHPGQQVGTPWLGWTCGVCGMCVTGRENLCEQARFTGYDIDGGYAEYVLADNRYCFKLPEGFSPRHAAPLLCAGLIGYRSLRLAGDAARLGLYGFGAAAHILTQFATAQGRRVFAFTRRGDGEGQSFARSLGAVWAGDSEERPPEPLDAAIIFAPVGALVPLALRAVAKGGRVVCGGIHMSDIPAFPYDLLWGERSLKSVANLTRQDGIDFFGALAGMTVRTEVEVFPLDQANEALRRLRAGAIHGAAVLDIG